MKGKAFRITGAALAAFLAAMLFFNWVKDSVVATNGWKMIDESSGALGSILAFIFLAAAIAAACGAAGRFSRREGCAFYQKNGIDG